MPPPLLIHPWQDPPPCEHKPLIRPPRSVASATLGGCSSAPPLLPSSSSSAGHGRLRDLCIPRAAATRSVCDTLRMPSRDTYHPRPRGAPHTRVPFMPIPAAVCQPLPLLQAPPARGRSMHRAQAARGPAPFAQPSPAAGCRRRRRWRLLRLVPIILSRIHQRASRSPGGPVVRPEGGPPAIRAGIKPAEEIRC